MAGLTQILDPLRLGYVTRQSLTCPLARIANVAQASSLCSVEDLVDPSMLRYGHRRDVRATFIAHRPLHTVLPQIHSVQRPVLVAPKLGLRRVSTFLVYRGAALLNSMLRIAQEPRQHFEEMFGAGEETVDDVILDWTTDVDEEEEMEE